MKFLMEPKTKALFVEIPNPCCNANLILENIEGITYFVCSRCGTKYIINIEFRIPVDEDNKGLHIIQ